LDNRRDSVFHVMRRHATREIAQSQLQDQDRSRTDLGRFGNHWHSSSGRKFESAGYRAVVVERSATSTNASSRCTDRGLQWVQPAMSFLIARNTLSVRRPRATAFFSSNRFSTFTTSRRRSASIPLGWSCRASERTTGSSGSSGSRFDACRRTRATGVP
jgi:hypothetical protein